MWNELGFVRRRLVVDLGRFQVERRGQIFHGQKSLLSRHASKREAKPLLGGTLVAKGDKTIHD